MTGEGAEVHLHDVSVRGQDVQAAAVVDAVRRAVTRATAGPVTRATAGPLDSATVEAALKRAITERR